MDTLLINAPNLTRKELILSLIKADMRNNKLITGLDNAGALVEDFYTDLGTVILKLVGFGDAERDDDLYDFYVQTMEELIDLEVSEFVEKLNYLAVDFYNELLSEKILRQENVVIEKMK